IAGYYSEHGTEVPIPVEENVISTVNIGILTFTQDRSAAGEFVKFAASQKGQDIFKQHNYRTDPP
ncbi:MAG: substrate-binding domain-containing protein, partial [Planctomycetota bacterium]